MVGKMLAFVQESHTPPSHVNSRSQTPSEKQRPEPHDAPEGGQANPSALFDRREGWREAERGPVTDRPWTGQSQD